MADWQATLDRTLRRFVASVLETERGLKQAIESPSDDAHDPSETVFKLLVGFFMSFASRVATRDRLHMFTTNYDRLIEYGCDLLGIKIIDRFVGQLAPIFDASKISLDLHYTPPGSVGEPRYAEGVVRLAKLHGSIDWRGTGRIAGHSEVQRYQLPFGAPPDFPEIPDKLSDRLLIYPNPAKDAETLEYPYADIFRDFATATCRPNAVVVTYGYGFGDDHVNRILRDMLSIPSTHLVIISFDYARGQLKNFYNQIGRDAQTTLLIGPHFADLDTLVDTYLPKPAIDRATIKMMELLRGESATI